MFVCPEDFEDWREEQTILEFENEFTHKLDFEACDEEVLAPISRPPSGRTLER